MFQIELEDKGLMECLDIMAHQLISPLLRVESIEQEIVQINEEHLQTVHSQSRAQYYALKMLVNKSHPFSRFFSGDSQSFNQQNITQLQSTLQSFYHQFYSANIMKLIIISSISPNFLFQQIKPLFSLIPNLNLDLAKLSNTKRIFRDKSYIVKYIAKSSHKLLHVFFELFAKKSDYSFKSLDYILEHFNNKIDKGFNHFLISHGYLHSLESYVVEHFQDQIILCFEFSLTSKGYRSLETVLQYFFEYLQSISKEDLERQLYDNLKAEAEFQFLYQSKTTDLFQMLNSFQNYPIHDLFFHEFNFNKFSPIQILEYLNYMDKEKAQYLVGNSRYKYLMTSVESDSHSVMSQYVYNYQANYQLHYQIMQNQMQIEEGNEEHQYSLFLSNSYLPNSTHLNQSCHSQYYHTPQLIFNQNHLQLWHLTFHHPLPLQIINFKLYSQMPTQNPQAQALNQLFLIYIQHLLQDHLYQAIKLTNIYKILIHSHLEAISITFKGHQQFLESIIVDFFKIIKKDLLTNRKFELYKLELEKKHYQVKKQKGINQAMDILKQSILLKFYSDIQIQKQLSKIKQSDLMEYKDSFFKNLYYEGYCTGWISASECIEIFKEQVEGSNNSSKQIVFKQKVKDLNLTDYQIVYQNINPHDTQNSVLLYVQSGIETLYKKVILEMITNKIQMLAIPYFITNKNISNYIFTQSQQFNKILGFSIALQSSSTNNSILIQELKLFWKTTLEYFQNMEVESFFMLKNKYITNIQQTELSIDQNNQYFWDQIESRSYNFQEKNQKIQFAYSIQLENVIDFIENKFDEGKIIIEVVQNNQFTSKEESLYKSQIQRIKDLLFFNNEEFQ